MTTLTFGIYFNQKIEPNSLPENLTNITFGYHFNQKIDSEMLPSNFGIHGAKWPIHIVRYSEDEWPLNIYQVQDKYTHPRYGPITVLINKENYQPYSFAKSALK